MQLLAKTSPEWASSTQEVLYFELGVNCEGKVEKWCFVSYYCRTMGRKQHWIPPPHNEHTSGIWEKAMLMMRNMREEKTIPLPRSVILTRGHTRVCVRAQHTHTQASVTPYENIHIVLSVVERTWMMLSGKHCALVVALQGQRSSHDFCPIWAWPVVPVIVTGLALLDFFWPVWFLSFFFDDEILLNVILNTEYSQMAKNQ